MFLRLCPSFPICLLDSIFGFAFFYYSQTSYYFIIKTVYIKNNSWTFFFKEALTFPYIHDCFPSKKNFFFFYFLIFQLPPHNVGSSGYMKIAKHDQEITI